MTIKGGTSPACAACKYQRRRCSPECPLASYFPASDPTIFQNAHKLFGVSKIMKILYKLDTQLQRDEAMKSIKFESNIRERFPVDGCVGYINLLQQQLNLYTQELQYLRAKLAIFREEGQDHSMDYQYSSYSELQLGMTPGNNPTPLSGLPYHPVDGMLMDYESSCNAMNGNSKDVYAESSNEIGKQMLDQDLNYNNGVDHSNQIAIQMQMDPSDQILQNQQENNVDCNDIKFDSMADDRQSYMISKKACDSSCDSSSRDTTENISMNELKSAAELVQFHSILTH